MDFYTTAAFGPDCSLGYLARRIHQGVQGALEPLFPGWCSDAKPVYVVYPPNRHLSKKVRVFVDWIAELFEKHDLMQRKSSLECSAAIAARQLKNRTTALVAAESALA